MIDWYKILEQFITTLGGVSIVGIVGYFGKKMFESFLKNKLEEHRNSLQKILEEHKNNLQILREENQIRFSKLHEDRAEVIKVQYKMLVQYDLSVKTYLMILKNLSHSLHQVEARKNWINGFSEFINNFQDNQIFFPETTCLMVLNFLEEMKAINENISGYLEKHYAKPTDNNFLSEDYLAKITDSERLIEKKITPIKKELEKEFRELLGVK